MEPTSTSFVSCAPDMLMQASLDAGRRLGIRAGIGPGVGEGIAS
jgi:hypothetical protein